MAKRSRTRKDASLRTANHNVQPNPLTQKSPTSRNALQAAIRFIRDKGIEILLAFVLGLATTYTWEHWLKGNSDALMSLRDRAVNARAEILQYATVTYFLRDHPNFHNDQSGLIPFGLDVPQSARDHCIQKLKLLYTDIKRVVGQKSNATTAIERVHATFVKNGVGTVAYGSPGFLSEMYSAKTPGEQTEIVDRYNDNKKHPRDPQRRDPIVVAPGARWYSIEDTVQVFNDLDVVIAEIGRLMAKS